MILTRDQINRYSRHIAISEISGAGQKKLIESAAAIVSESTSHAGPLLYYLSALGTGRIYCAFHDDAPSQELFDHVKDLNPDTHIQLVQMPAFLAQLPEKASIIVIGSKSFISETCGIWINQIPSGSPAPAIIAVVQDWTGVVQTFKKPAEFRAINSHIHMDNSTEAKPIQTVGSVFSYFAAGAVCAMEHAKCILDLGKPLVQGFSFDLLEMRFSDSGIFDALQNKAVSAGSTIFDPISVADARVLIVGSGGLGSPVAYTLAAAGVGTLGLVDYDTVDVSNLNRQIMHATSRLGMPKVKSAEIFLKKVNPDIKLELHPVSFSRENALELVQGYDIIIDGLDNLPTRYLLNDACRFEGKTLVSAGVLGFTGLATTFVPDGHCYRCVFPEEKNTGPVPSCAETGVLGPVPGLMGVFEAAEAFKHLAGLGAGLTDRLVLFDALEMDFYTPSRLKDPNCALCGNTPTIDKLRDYVFICGSKKD